MSEYLFQVRPEDIPRKSPRPKPVYEKVYHAFRVSDAKAAMIGIALTTEDIIKLQRLARWHYKENHIKVFEGANGLWYIEKQEDTWHKNRSVTAK